MKLVCVVASLALLSIGCSSAPPAEAPAPEAPAAPPPVEATTTSAAPAPSAAPAASAATSAAPQAETAKKVAIIGFTSSAPKDKGLCWELVGTPEALADFNKDRAKNTQTVVKQMKITGGKQLATCPTEGQVGSCVSAFGLRVHYAANTFNLDKAKAHCTGDQMGTWE